jgi:GR25 family glycosyltransferase involved in LPS biosynthesis
MNSLPLELHYVNLLHRTDRKKAMEKELECIHNFPVYHFQAIQPTFELLYQLVESQMISKDDYIRILSEKTSMITKGSVGCFLSHLELLKQCVEYQKIFIILEDDVTIHPQFVQIIIDGLQSIDYSFDRIYLGQPLPLWKSHCQDHNLYFWKLSQGYYGTFGYIIHPKHAEFLLQNIKRITNHIDNTFLTLHQESTTVFLFKTQLVHTEVHRNRDSNVLLKRVRVSKLFIPTTLCCLESIHPTWKTTNPNFVMKVFDTMSNLHDYLKENGGFFVNKNLACKTSLAFIFQHCDLVRIKDSNLFYGCVPETFDLLFQPIDMSRPNTLITPSWFIPQLFQPCSTFFNLKV